MTRNVLARLREIMAASYLKQGEKKPSDCSAASHRGTEKKVIQIHPKR
jgi:hypothetical protein